MKSFPPPASSLPCFLSITHLQHEVVTHLTDLCFYRPIFRTICAIIKPFVGRKLETLADQHFKFTFCGPLLLSLHISVVELLSVFTWTIKCWKRSKITVFAQNLKHFFFFLFSWKCTQICAQAMHILNMPPEWW